jgi:hypothetical protein
MTMFARRHPGLATEDLHFLSRREFDTIVCVVEGMVPQEGRLISAEIIGVRVDTFLARTAPPFAMDIRLALMSLEFILPLMILRIPPFSRLSPRSRRRLLEKIVASRGRLRKLARMLKTLITFCYYTHPTVRQMVGYVEFEQRPRFTGMDTTPYQYAPPQADHDGIL